MHAQPAHSFLVCLSFVSAPSCYYYAGCLLKSPARDDSHRGSAIWIWMEPLKESGTGQAEFWVGKVSSSVRPDHSARPVGKSEHFYQVLLALILSC